MPFKILGASPLLEHALSNAWDKPALETCPLKCLGHARSWDMPRLHDRNRIASVIMSCGHCCNVSDVKVSSQPTRVRGRQQRGRKKKGTAFSMPGSRNTLEKCCRHLAEIKLGVNCSMCTDSHHGAAEYNNATI